jgi:uncharacterized protein (DUF2384 family)
VKSLTESILKGTADMTEKMTTEQLREIAYQEVLELFENDRAAAGKWMSSSVLALGNHPPISLMGTKIWH